MTFTDEKVAFHTSSAGRPASSRSASLHAHLTSTYAHLSANISAVGRQPAGNDEDIAANFLGGGLFESDTQARGPGGFYLNLVVDLIKSFSNTEHGLGMH